MPTERFPNLKRATRLAAAAIGLSGLVAGAGCQVVALAGFVGESIEREGSHKVYADYVGLQGKTWAVIIAADRTVQSNDPRAITRMTNGIVRKIAMGATGATGFVPGPKILAFQYNKPSWATLPYGKLADEFGVDRLIFIDLTEYRLGEPGNSYVWSAVVAGKVGVVEADGPAPDEFAFTKEIAVKYPDKSGVTTRDENRAAVQANLEDRFSNRVSWLFFDHDEANRITY